MNPRRRHPRAHLVTVACAAVAAALALTGCASAQMPAFVGTDIREMMIPHGPPVNAFDMATGKRAFQFVSGGGRPDITRISPISSDAFFTDRPLAVNGDPA